MRLSLFLVATLGLSACATQQDATPPATATPKADMGARPRVAGPFRRCPSFASKREPWQGQSQLRSASFQCTTHPRCGHTAECRCRPPPGSRHAATLCRPRRNTAPSPAARPSRPSISPPLTQSA